MARYKMTVVFDVHEEVELNSTFLSRINKKVANDDTIALDDDTMKGRELLV